MGGAQSQHFVRVSDDMDPLEFMSMVFNSEDLGTAKLSYHEVSEPEHNATLIMHPDMVYQARWKYRVNSSRITMLRMVVAVKDFNDPTDKRGVSDIPKPVNGKVPFSEFGDTVLHFLTDFPIGPEEKQPVPYDISVWTKFAPKAYGPETRVAAWFYLCDQADNVLIYYTHDRVVSVTYGVINKPPFSVPLIQAPDITSRSRKHVEHCSPGLFHTVSSNALNLFKGVTSAMTQNLYSVADPVEPAMRIEPTASIPKVLLGPTANSAQSMATLDSTLARGGSTGQSKASSREPAITNQRSIGLGASVILLQDTSVRKPLWYNRRVSLSVLQLLVLLVALLAIAVNFYLTLNEQNTLLKACLHICPHEARVSKA